MKRKTYSGYGVFKMLDTAHKYGLTEDNSTLYVKDTTDLESYWRITIKG